MSASEPATADATPGSGGGSDPKTTLVPGGPHIAARFGGWQKALTLAGVIEPEPAP